MKIILRQAPDYKTNEYCILEFTGRFEGDEEESRSGLHLGILEKVNPNVTKNKATHILEMGSMDLSGYEVEKLDESFVHIETVEKTSDYQVLMIKGIVTKKVVFMKRPYPNIERITEVKKVNEKFNLFKKN